MSIADRGGASMSDHHRLRTGRSRPILTLAAVLALALGARSRPAGNRGRRPRETAEKDKPDIIFGDAFGNEEAVRRVAAAYPTIALVFGSGGGPAEPHFSVFDNWIPEPAHPPRA